MIQTPRSSLSSRGILAAATGLVARLFGAGDGSTAALRTTDPRLLLGPVAGRSTRWIAAPPHLAVPVGSALSFEFGWDEPHRVDWRGALPGDRNATVATAETVLERAGRRRIEVTASSLDGRQIYAWTLEVDVLPRSGCAADASETCGFAAAA